MRKTNGVDAYVYVKRAHVLENYPLVVSVSGAILCDEALPPDCIDLITVLDRQGKEITVYDYYVAEIYPWALMAAKGITYSSGNKDTPLPDQPTMLPPHLAPQRHPPTTRPPASPPTRLYVGPPP